MHMEVGALFGRFVWRGINIDDVTIHPSRGSKIPHWRCANTTGSHTLHSTPTLKYVMTLFNISWRILSWSLFECCSPWTVSIN